MLVCWSTTANHALDQTSTLDLDRVEGQEYRKGKKVVVVAVVMVLVVVDVSAMVVEVLATVVEVLVAVHTSVVVEVDDYILLPARLNLFCLSAE